MWRHLCAHCWPVRPGISAATAAQRLPCLACAQGWLEKSNTCQKTLCDCSIVGRKGSYLKSRELDVFGVGPRRALEVQIGHLGFHVCVGEGIGRAVLGVEWPKDRRPATDVYRVD